jgi:thioredoxin reductase (NADPH)
MVGVHEGVLKGRIVDTLRKHKQSEAADLIGAEHYHINNRHMIKNTVERLRMDYSDSVTILETDATELQATTGGYTVVADGKTFAAAGVVLATGIMDEQPEFESHDRAGNVVESPRPLYSFANRETALYCIRCEGHLTHSDPVAVIGRSESAAQVAFMFYERYGNPVYLLGHGAEPDLAPETARLCKIYGIEIIPEKITDFISAEVGQLCGFEFDGHPSIKVRFAMINMGIYRAYNDLARQVGAQLADPDLPPEKSQILIDHKGETTLPNLFAVGDVAFRADEPVMKQIYTAQEYAVRAVDSIDHRRRKQHRSVALAS